MRPPFKLTFAIFTGFIVVAIIFWYGIARNASISLDVVNSVIAANGIILGFWSALLAIPKVEQKELWLNRTTTETAIISTLSTLIVSIFFMSAAAVGIINTIWALFWAVLSFYIVCWVLGITLHYVVLGNLSKK